MSVSRKRRKQLRIYTLDAVWKMLDAGKTYECVHDIAANEEESRVINEQLDRLSQKYYNEMVALKHSRDSGE